MKLEGRKIIVNKSSKQLFEMLKNPKAYENLMPENLSSFETSEDGFKFSLKGMPDISLKIEKMIENEEVVLKSATPSLDFSLRGTMFPISETQTEVQIHFEGKFNTFIKMMVQKPLQNFIDNLTDGIEKL